ncbi:hypothetical protein SAMN02745248_00812 [Hathewaya proteolytica DSM 3090]|uniref:Uncharacterized protein n=1 Tax=Hathewaya proteolytica DSM 3090 TaxID=1121331 RepID=A0A1M6LT82_9CLOT|nr:hypothetical protein [Hathewaya proteolytica]SHJ74399.1 hypothetical protein SAMN02745248_00812 [Hathewaya proteolytica DSM 3090]
MLQEKLNECRVLMAEVSQNKQKDNEHQNVVKRNNTFFDTYKNYFLPIVKGYAVCKKYSHVSFTDKTIDELSKYIDYSKKTFEQKTVINPAKYQDGVKKLSEKIQSEWKSQTDDYLAGIKEELGILKLVSNEKQEIQKILACMNNFSNWPVDEAVSSQYETANEKANEILSKMEFDVEIANFLKKVKDKEASLLDLTDSIIDWIRREELSGNIILSIKN